ncbi:energy transducer TonB [Vibrio europaeus]|uniref:Energy transducer TonB n=1 Tax=Vibrio europaeus TaxID=300876 RepID=A0A178J780_9VIBR|nr:energy transducer TonB [Vibrio europaeus]MDC5705217.1 energy transducer TonB [Vibrio europaeus]MDC5710496.1 energy transducer TonB [Vibrio europaeus]MDC5715586.1 energy transducer TonB [Vibrio europaeus]MDC5719747.1 energy transducer TonB [Vibrio europaeus]MDC5724365.1 energy transducer TonB [Vibrio europaeus]
MNVKRYTIAGSISLAIHAAFVFVAQEPKAFAMPAGAQSSSVSINFKAVATPPATPVEQPVTQSQPKAEPEPSKEQVTPPEPQKVVKQPKPVEKKVVKKKPKVEKKVTKAKPVPKKQPVANQTKEKPAQKVVEKKQAPKQHESKAQPGLVNQGASSQPVMVTKPSFLTRPSAPRYPRLARKRGVEGIALYEIWLDKDGKQVKQVLISSSGTDMLDKSALAAIKKWRFSPHSVDGQKMAHRVQIPVRFKLDR